MTFQRSHLKAAKKTPLEILQIRLKYSQGSSQGELAREFGLSVGQIGKIVRNEVWQSVGATPRTEGEVQLNQITQERILAGDLSNFEKRKAQESQKRFFELSGIEIEPARDLEVEPSEPSKGLGLSKLSRILNTSEGNSVLLDEFLGGDKNDNQG